MKENKILTLIVKKKELIIEIIASLFVLLFIYTGVSKLLELKSFQAILRQSPLISNVYVLVSWAIPLTELLLSLMLLFQRTRILGIYGAAILMSTFTIYIGYMLALSPHLPCSCGGILQQMSWTDHLIFNAFFTGIAGIGIWLYHKQFLSPKESAILA